MIFGNIKRLDDASFYPEPLVKALSFLKDADLENMEPGVYEIDGRDLYAEVQSINADFVENRKAESHSVYVDVQYLVSGAERIGHAVLLDSAVVKEDLRPDKDLIYYEDPAGETMLTMTPGDFAVFFPSDIHKPGCESGGCMAVKKVVVKVKYDTI